MVGLQKPKYSSLLERLAYRTLKSIPYTPIKRIPKDKLWILYFLKVEKVFSISDLRDRLSSGDDFIFFINRENFSTGELLILLGRSHLPDKLMIPDTSEF